MTNSPGPLPGQEEAGQSASEQLRLPISVPALEKYMLDNVPGFTAPVSVKQFNLGQSNPTYFLTVRLKRNTADGRVLGRRKGRDQ